MNHLSRKKKLYGAGSKKPKVKPAVLLPPKIGEYQFESSFSYVETLDLISDGPIEGLVNNKGSLLFKNEQSKGVYLNETPVSTSEGTEEEPEHERSLKNDTSVSKDIQTFANLISGKSLIAHVTHVETDNVGPFGVGAHKQYFLTLRDLVVGERTPILFGFDANFFPDADGDGIPELFTELTKSFSLTTRSYVYITDINDRKENYFAIFMNKNTINNSDLFVCLSKFDYKKFRDRSNPFEKNDGLLRCANEIIKKKFNLTGVALNMLKQEPPAAHILTQILEAYDSYGPTSDGGEPSNPFMRKLIMHKLQKVFSNLSVGKGEVFKIDEVASGEISAKELIRDLLEVIWRVGYMIMYIPDRDILHGIGEAQFTDPREVSLIPTEADGKYSPMYGRREYNDLLIPICDADGKLEQNADILGAAFIIVRLPWRGASVNPYSIEPATFDVDGLSTLKKITKLTVAQVRQNADISNFRYNYNNVLIESRNGEEYQEPFRFFNKIYIDKTINKAIYGPYRSFGQVQRVDGSFFTKSTLAIRGPSSIGFNEGEMGPDPDPGEKPFRGNDGLPIGEGSNDNARLTNADYNSWSEDGNSFGLDEAESPSVYYVNNPNVSEVFVTLKVDALRDTAEGLLRGGDPESNDSFKAGDKLPAILNIQIEVGKVTSEGLQKPTLTKNYRIAALIEGTTLIDIGNPDNTNRPNETKSVSELSGGVPKSSPLDNVFGPQLEFKGGADLATPFPLPRVNDYSLNNSYSSPEKRYVKVRKLSTETFSVLISKDVAVQKVTEIIPVNLTYPFSAIIGTKIDSKSFGRLPSRSFDARLKLIQIPSNYHPTEEFHRRKDKRYYDTTSEFENASKEKKSIYQGDWNGAFKIGWTDNPAWILYDLLTNTRYGLGRYLEENDINKWELYKIGRFCDAVDSNGDFEGVPDGRGGLEPRYSCNIMLNSNEKVFDSIQLISKLFRGQTFFRASEVSFVDERIKSPIATFSNNNVKDGAFNYSNLRRDQQFNTAEVSYLDRFENFTPKVEVVEDEEDIRSRGVFKNRIDGLGVTSRAMARRIGQHLIYRTIKENQRVAFISGLEALLCQPGDLIIVDDDLKNEKSNFGKVLSVDAANQYIQLSGPFFSDSMTGILTVYNPTGENSIEHLGDIAQTKRARTDTFTITSSPAPSFNIYTGLYNFSGYTDGYTDTNIESLRLFSEYALYTGTGDNMLYFGTGYTGWTFATGLEEVHRSFVAKSTGVQNLDQLNTGFISSYNNGVPDKRGGTDIDISGLLSGDLNELNTRGILESEIAQNSQPHITTFNVTTAGVGDGFGFASGVDNPEVLPFIKLGSPYRFDLKDGDNTLYKIDSIKENNPNEYLVSAAKFDTGKFSLIENSISLDRKENTYDFNVATQIGDTIFKNLSAPSGLSLITGEGTETSSFFISGDWSGSAEDESYEVVLSRPNGGRVSVNVPDKNVKFDNLFSIGNYALSVKAIGNSVGSTKTSDSEFSTESIFVLHQELEEFDRSFITNITFK
tara:strand:- start:21867 stop:26393 length:4527 start_codon:yes stop_codon:yes gene_type:complete